MRRARSLSRVRFHLRSRKAYETIIYAQIAVLLMYDRRAVRDGLQY